MNIRKDPFKIYWKVQNILVSRLKFSQYLYEDILNSYTNPNITWLDLGCGQRILPEWRLEEEKSLVKKCKMVVGIDYDSNSLTRNRSISFKVRGDISKIPFKENSFDLVTANMVVEHLVNPEEQFQEINKILKPDGVMIFHTPNIFGYTTIMRRLVPKILKNKLIFLLDGREKEDVFDTYYKANSKKRIINLAQKSGFNILKIKMIVSTAMFAIIPPLAIFELICIKILMTKLFKPLRPNIIAILKKSY